MNKILLLIKYCFIKKNIIIIKPPDHHDAEESVIELLLKFTVESYE